MYKKKILVTGGAGFIGREVVKILVQKGHKVVIVDEFISNSPEGLPKGVEIIKGDITDPKIISKSFKNVEYCVHLASKIGGLRYIESQPATILSVNNKINTAVFDASVKFKIKKIVFISSGMVYSAVNKPIIHETDISNAIFTDNCYSTSKMMGEAYCKAYNQQYGLNYTIVRLFNVYGNFNKSEKSAGSNHVIQEITNKIISGQYPLEIFGSGDQVRTFTHVTDAAQGIVECIFNKNTINQDFNISSDEKIKIIDLAKLLWTYSNIHKPFRVKHLKTFTLDSRVRVPSTAKAKRLLGWSSKISIKDGLKEYVYWMLNNYSKT
jgi:UDP-glucose 4-epimerase